MAADRVAGWWFPPAPQSLLFPANSLVPHDSCEFRVTVATSSAGLRDREYTSGPPPEGTVRIAAVGDSFTFGWGVAQEEAWPEQLELLLNASTAGENDTDYEVLNCGVPGTSFHEYENAAALIIQHFRPQVLIVGTLQGDDLIQLHGAGNRPGTPLSGVADTMFPTTRQWLKNRTQPEPMRPYRETFLQSQQYIRSQFGTKQRTRYESLPARVRNCFEQGLLNPSLIQTSIETPDRFLVPVKSDRQWHATTHSLLKQSLLRILAICEAYNCSLVVAIVPNGPYVSRHAAEGMREIGYTISEEMLSTDAPDRLVEEVCAQHDILCLSCTQEFRELDVECYFTLDGHFSSAGHREFATRVHPKIAEGALQAPFKSGVDN